MHPVWTDVSPTHVNPRERSLVMKNAFRKASNWVLGRVLADVDAGACLPPDCCRRNRRMNCAACIVHDPSC